MPVHQGIKLSVISQLELRIHPEFPHPESSQFTYRTPFMKDEGNISSCIPPSLSCDSKADKVLGRPSTISVYIPSHPAARFWLRYDVSEAKEPKAPWYYFKLFMNGRHITSWGTNSTSRPSGQVMRALYDPTPRWNYKHDETIYKNCGTEIRPFYFSNIKGRSAADDGGLIEVRVFRSRGRCRRQPSPDQFKPQDQYGLVLPSTGLIDDPLEATYFDWILIDPTDKPLSTFKFHYRSWDNLSSLHLIPNNHARALLFPSPSLLSLNGQSAKALRRKETAKDEDTKVHGEHTENSSNEALGTFGRRSGFMHNHNSFKPHGTSSTHVRTPLTKDTYDDEFDASGSADRKAAFQVPRSPSPYYRNLSPPALQALGFSAPPVPHLPPAAQLEWAQMMNRPLPEIPHGNESSRSSRRPSVVSKTRSLTPSLEENYDQGALSSSPTAKTTTGLKFQKPKHPPKLIEAKRNSITEYDPADSEVVPAALALPSKHLSSGIFSNMTLSRHRKHSPSKSRSTVVASSSGYNQSEQQRRGKNMSYNDGTTPLSFTESEWLSNARSSTKYVSKYRKSRRARGMGRDDDADSEEIALLRNQAMDWYDSAAGNVSDHVETDSSEDYTEVMVPGGWI